MNPYLKDRDILDQALEHSWGKTADAKAKEKAYNREYYQRHKEEILRKARQAGEGIQRTAQNAYNQARDTAQNAYNQASKFTGQYRTSTEQRGTANKNKMYAKTWDTFHKMMNYVPDKDMDEYMKKGGYTDQDIKDFHENRKYVNQFTRQQYRQRGTAANEAAKAARNSDPARRAINNAKAGARDAFNNARDYIDTVTGKKGKHANTQSTADVSRYENTRNAYDSLHRASSAAAANEAAKSYANATRDPHRYANRRASSAAAANEAAKAYANAERGYDARYDTKLGRDLQNTYSKVRRTGRESKQALDNAMNTAKSTLTKAQKEALKKREEAKRRMQKWFKR